MTLREKVLEQYAWISAEAVRKVDPDGAQMLDGKWYVQRWGCDTLAHILDALLSTSRAEPVTPLRKGLEDAFRAGQRLGLWQMKYTGPDNVPPQPIPPGEDETLDALLSTADSEQREAAALRNDGDFLAIAAERDDLRRKLEVAERDCENAATARNNFAFQLRDERLAIAALRTALEWLVNLYHGMSKGGPDTSPPSDAEFVEAIESGEAALALPADSLAQEVVWLLSNAVVDKDETPTIQWDEWDGRRDALLARIGVKT